MMFAARSRSLLHPAGTCCQQNGSLVARPVRLPPFRFSTPRETSTAHETHPVSWSVRNARIFSILHFEGRPESMPRKRFTEEQVEFALPITRLGVEPPPLRVRAFLQTSAGRSGAPYPLFPSLARLFIFVSASGTVPFRNHFFFANPS